MSRGKHSHDQFLTKKLETFISASRKVGVTPDHETVILRNRRCKTQISVLFKKSQKLRANEKPNVNLCFFFKFRSHLCTNVTISNKHGPLYLYRVIQNDCWGYNNLSYTIHFRQEYVDAPRDQEILKVFFYDVRCVVVMHFSAWSAVY